MMFVLDPTEASNVPETESLRAWSQEEPTELVDYRPRNWRLPIVALTAAFVVLAGAAYLAWPQTSATKLQVAPTKPQVAETQDQKFVRLLTERKVTVVSPPMAVKAAHAVCEKAGQGVPDPVLAQALVESTPGTDLRTESIFVDTTREIYCP